MTNRHLNSTLRSLRRFLYSAHVQSTPRRCYTTAVAAGSAREDRVNAYVSYNESAYASKTSPTGTLCNLPIAVKDNICTKQFKTTCSSAMLQDFVSPYDATVVRLLCDAGARIVGKTNCDEFGMGSHNVHSFHGAVVNPYQPEYDSTSPGKSEQRSAGGSSGGSAAAVASGSCFAALGTDTGGSVRLPAAYCGLVGFKPSYGLISRWGVVSYADSLDCVGILAKETRDIKPIFTVLSKHDPKDPTSASEDVRTKMPSSIDEIFRRKNCFEGLTVGIPREYFPGELDRSAISPLRDFVKSLKLAGAKIVSVSLPSTPYALSSYYVIASAEASSNLAKYSGIHYGLCVPVPPGADKKKVSKVYAYTRSKGFGHEVQKRILLGTYALTADAFDNYFLKAQRVRNLIKADFDRVFRSPNPLTPSRHKIKKTSPQVDVLLHPSAVGPAPLLADTTRLSRLDAYVQDVLTVPASLAGLPALSVPAGLAKDGWPLGVSVVGQWGHDELVLKVGDIIGGLAKPTAA